MENKGQHIEYEIKEEAKRLGFLACGYSKAAPLPDERGLLLNYLQNGYHGKMEYLERNIEKRLNPQELVEGTKTVISVLYNYFYPDGQNDENAPVLSKYAYGKDYHLVVKEKLEQLLSFIQQKTGSANGRAFVDSAPVLEKAWAQKAGLGWIGKNGNLINKQFGSFFFIGELLVDIELETDEKPAVNYCGQCSRCIDTCPTQAIVSAGIVNGSRCISYLTIELKDEIPDEFSGKLKNRVFGCDICQDVCPFNKKALTHNEPEFLMNSELKNLSEKEWFEMDNTLFNKLFKQSAVKRSKFSGLKRNLNFLKKNV